MQIINTLGGFDSVSVLAAVAKVATEASRQDVRKTPARQKKACPIIGTCSGKDLSGAHSERAFGA
jgi:hypothetical protein